MSSIKSLRFGGIITSIISPVFFLIFITLALPNYMQKGDFAEWRTFSIAVSFAGISHLGVIDSLYMRWVRGGENEYVALRSVAHIISIIFLVGLFVSLIFSLILKISFFPIFFGSLILSTYSLSFYHLLVFESGWKLNLYLISQGLIFTVLIELCIKINVLSFNYVYISYIASFIPVIYRFALFIKVKHLQNNQVKVELSGLYFMFANLSLILLINVDKIFARVLISGKNPLSEYLLASSLVVAASTIGSSLGNLLLSKNYITLPNRSHRLSILFFSMLFGLTFSKSLNNLLSRVFPAFEINFTLFIHASILVFVISALYLPLCRFLDPRKTITLILCICVTFILIVSLGRYFINLDIMLLLVISYVISLVICCLVLDFTIVSRRRSL